MKSKDCDVCMYNMYWDARQKKKSTLDISRLGDIINAVNETKSR